MEMTWGEFKEFVDNELKNRGEDDAAVINFINITETTEDMCLSLAPDGFAVY